MRIVSKTDIGRQRLTNQDSYAVGELPGGVAWAVVCDGMGGANGGNIASEAAVKIVSEHIASYYRQGMESNAIRSMLRSAVFAANMDIFDRSKKKDSLTGMGTTVVAVLVSHSVAHIAHAGDSRAYLLSDTGIRQITRDHSIVQAMIETGQLTEEEARVHPRKNVITRALGVDELIDIDYNEIETAPHDAILICTDGLTNYLKADHIVDILSGAELEEYPDRLIRAANENGGGDNITVVVLSQ